MVCVSESVGRRVVAWWIEKGRKGGVKDTVTQKQKDALFPQTTFPFFSLFFSSFSFSQLSPFLTLSCCATIHSLSLNQRTYYPQHMCTSTKNTTPKQHNTKSISSCFSHIQILIHYIFHRQVISLRYPLCHDYASCIKLYSFVKSII